LRNKAIRFETEIGEDLPFRAVGGEIRQVLSNLLSNAIDAVGHGGRVRCIVRRTVIEDSSYAEFCVEDDGCGIAAERIPGLFVPFRSTKGALGNGLGL